MSSLRAQKEVLMSNQELPGEDPPVFDILAAAQQIAADAGGLAEEAVDKPRDGRTAALAGLAEQVKGAQEAGDILQTAAVALGYNDPTAHLLSFAALAYYTAACSLVFLRDALESHPDRCSNCD